AIAATQAGKFKDEIISLQITRADGSTDTHHIDEGIRFDASLDGIKGVKLIAENGKHTAASASQICDGASGVMVVNEKGLKSLGVKPLARIHHMTMMGGDPVIMLDAPLHATKRALEKAGMTADDIDLFEVNEAFAAVPVAWLKTTGADPARLNVNGGAIALGHPLGGTGTKLISVLISLVPVAPSGWPSAIAPPFTLSLAGSASSAFSQASGTGAKASLTSYRSMSSIFMPAFFN